METEQVSKSPAPMTRRQFLEVTAFVAGMAGVAAVSPKSPFEALSNAAPGQVTATSTETWVPTVCRLCLGRDGIRVKVVNGQAVNIEGDPRDLMTKGHICARGTAGLWMLYDPYRVKAPLKRTAASKGINVDPQWQEISWDEAYTALASQIKALQAKGTDGWIINTISGGGAVQFSQFGRSFSTAMTTGVTNVEGGMNWCGHVGHYVSRVAHNAFVCFADYARCNYVIHFGSSPGFGGGGTHVGNAYAGFNAFAGIIAEARSRGMKVVNIDPMLNVAGAKADDWIPILPGTDGAMAAAMLEVILVELKTFDTQFIKKWTNGPYLIGSDGTYVRDTSTQKPLIWDPVDGVAKTYDDASIKDFAISGSYAVNGNTVKPSFQLVVDSVTTMTPEWAEQITTVPAATTRRIATEFVAAAQIGSTITLNGKVYPFRPACVEWYGANASNHLHGNANGWAIELLNTVIGAQDTPGGSFGTAAPYIYGGPDGMIEHPRAAYSTSRSYSYEAPWKFVYPPTDPMMEVMFPNGDHFGAVSYNVLANPDKFWGLGKHGIDMAFFHATNPLIGMYDTSMMDAIFQQIPFMAYISLNIEETAQGYADIILPDRCYLEEYQVMGDLFMQPVQQAPFNIPYITDSFIEIADRAGILYGPKGLNAAMFGTWKPDYKLDLNTKYKAEQIFDGLCKNTFGATKNLAAMKSTGGSRNLLETYAVFRWYESPPPDNKPRRLPVYIEKHVESREALRTGLAPHMAEVQAQTGVDWNTKLNDIQPVPVWIPSHIQQDTPPYDLIAAAWMSNMNTWTMTNTLPWLSEIAVNEDPYANYVWLNTKTAAARGIADGDLVWVEAETTQSAIGTMAHKIEARARVSEGIHPQVVGFNRSQGGWGRNEIVKKLWANHLNPTYQLLRPDKIDYIDGCTDALENLVKVRVYKVVG